MSLMSWLGKKIRLTDGAFWGAFFGGETWAGKPVTLHSSMNVSAWFRCIKLHSEVAGALPFKVYERLANDDRRIVRDHPVALLTSLDPNADQTTQEFWGGHAAQLCMVGNAYAEKRFSGARLVALHSLPFEDVRPYRAESGELRYKFTDRSKAQDLPQDKILHTRGWGFGGDMGLSPLSYARETLGGALATEETAARVYGKGLRATGIFTTPHDMTPAQIAQFQKNFVKPMEGPEGEGKQMLLPPGFEHKVLNILPKDAEMLLSRRFNVEDVCRFMGVPPILVGHAAEGQTMWGTGVENIILAWLTLGLDSFLTTIEKSVNKRLFIAADRVKFYAEFDRNALLRADSAARAEFISKMIQNAQMTPNEGRKKDNRPPMEGGNELYVNSTMVPLTLAGRKPAPVAPAETKTELPPINVSVPITFEKKAGKQITDIEHDKKGRAVRTIKYDGVE